MLVSGKGGGISPGNAAQGLFHWAVGSELHLGPLPTLREAVRRG